MLFCQHQQCQPNSQFPFKTGIFATSSQLVIYIASASPFLPAGSETLDGTSLSGKNEGGK